MVSTLLNLMLFNITSVAIIHLGMNSLLLVFHIVELYYLSVRYLVLTTTILVFFLFQQEMQRFVTKIVDLMREESLFSWQGGPIIMLQVREIML